jgi:chemotaxis protein histidine kinase CheA
MAKISKKKLVKYIKAINKLDLLEDDLATSGDVDDLMSDFMDAIEEIDDDNNIGEVPDDIVDFYESQVEDDDDEDDEEEKPKKKKKKAKKSKKSSKKKKKAKDEDEDDEDEDDEDEDEDEDDDSDDDEDDDDEDDEDEEEEKPKKKKKAKKGKKPAKKKGKAKKEKKSKKKKPAKKTKATKKGKKKKSDLPKGLRVGTLPAIVFEKIKDGGEVTLMELAEVVAEEKDRDADKCINLALRTVARKVSKAVDVYATFTGGDESNTVLSLTPPEGDEDDDE